MTHQPLSVAVQRLDPDLPLPAIARNGDAGVDLYARENAMISARGGRILMPTGLAIAIPLGFAGFVVPRSGMALKNGITLVNTPGIIDSGYRGELKVVMINTDPTVDYLVTRGDRIAQLLIQRIETIEWNEVDNLDGEDRGGGFGHSGR
ncbi:MAG: dUTP diphosphatase [Actinobacteria bacterium]|nr:MAG: dUTP diphosphatase [Actinomycetota bacterium]